MIQRKVPRNDTWIALRDNEAPVFFKNSRRHFAYESAPRVVRVLVPVKNLPTLQRGLKVDLSRKGIRHASSSQANAFV
jgi:hypothetical protein